MDRTIPEPSMYDIFFLSYDEPMADGHWNLVKTKLPTARHVRGIKGIHEAHQQCARMSRTSHLYVIDADSEVLDYDFRFKVSSYDAHYVHLWRARNPLNGLEYGWGGIKLFPKQALINLSPGTLDMTMSFGLKLVDSVKSVTHFNYSKQGTWRSAFREAVKLTCALPNEEAAERLAVWTTVAKGIHSDACLAGAREGRAYGEQNRGNPEALRLINDYDWLQARFEAS